MNGNQKREKQCLKEALVPPVPVRVVSGGERERERAQEGESQVTALDEEFPGSRFRRERMQAPRDRAGNRVNVASLQAQLSSPHLVRTTAGQVPPSGGQVAQP